jgi:6,7-dimethyl-8-ribityllumazine synthase
MIKGITTVARVATEETFDQLNQLLQTLGFEPGKGWTDATGKGAAFLAPLGNLEIAIGYPPAQPTLLIEVTQLDAVHAAIKTWNAASQLTEPALTTWNSRLFHLQLTNDLAIAFWESEHPLHNKPIAIEGDLSAANKRFAIVVARWNAVITDRLVDGALDALLRSGAARRHIEIVRVPGAWEVPAAARIIAERVPAFGGPGSVDAIITLGCLIRGETAHYEAIYNEVARGIGQSQQETGIPHTFGVLTCENLEQALHRAGVKAGNKGFEAAVAAIEMVSLRRKLLQTGEEA